MKVKEVLFDEQAGSVVLLVDKEESRILPIWIGMFEAQAIAMTLHGVMTPRPMTHDLMNSLCQTMGAQVKKIVVSDIREGTYYAEIYLTREQEEIVMDSRPSDAIALALRAGVELYVTEKVGSQAVNIQELDEEKQSELKKLLDSLKPDDDQNMLH
ncbi:MAG: bifunctional nuclease family protein [Candidatus Syntrophonatronum acetioxidans]|uniref:Bifunctional nuclease family protein n=1 Tax=Candidatus Syntrophonatronum acetioxidans TaxID=1795816 RepID=A0A424YEW9_9FIRM|nr:MAG: bifunctional nuclease family protein [Candidatus Syntrophonatronum acetioxidans]